MRAAVDGVHAAQAQLADSVALARKAGVSWDEAAQIVGMTRQGVSKRYGGARDR